MRHLWRRVNLEVVPGELRSTPVKLFALQGCAVICIELCSADILMKLESELKQSVYPKFKLKLKDQYFNSGTILFACNTLFIVHKYYIIFYTFQWILFWGSSALSTLSRLKCMVAHGNQEGLHWLLCSQSEIFIPFKSAGSLASHVNKLWPIFSFLQCRGNWI